ncbi:E3 ubiquitin-protein ligase TRIM39-like isoform X2 [Mixophyes fleayi]|uniref:E3 ubiquitin-protein ligase TRIM39-like isoform X2 n=1 Tax=Mixophyes fleayi TaxID=3061075 RepID=UPI003F4DAEA8
MESATLIQPNGPHQDDETTKVEAHISPTVTRNKEPALSRRDVRNQLSEIQIVSWHLVSDLQNKMSTIQEDAVMHKSKLCKDYRGYHHLLETEEEMRMANSKSTEDQTIQALEDKALELVQLMEMLKKRKKTKEQIQVIGAQLKTLARSEVGLNGCDSPVQLRIASEMKHIVKPVPELIQFDPRSAHPNLILSADLREAKFQSSPQLAEPSKHCFEPGLYVLGMPGFKSGRHYWEVDVGNKSNWIIGVVRESVERKGAWELNSSNGYWVLRKQEDDVFYGIGENYASLQLKTSPLRIGVSLDLFRSHLCFYDADTAELIFQLTDCFVQEKLFPFFCPGIPVREEDWGPLTLCNHNIL